MKASLRHVPCLDTFGTTGQAPALRHRALTVGRTMRSSRTSHPISESKILHNCENLSIVRNIVKTLILFVTTDTTYISYSRKRSSDSYETLQIQRKRKTRMSQVKTAHVADLKCATRMFVACGLWIWDSHVVTCFIPADRESRNKVNHLGESVNKDHNGIKSSFSGQELHDEVHRHLVPRLL